MVGEFRRKTSALSRRRQATLRDRMPHEKMTGTGGWLRTAAALAALLAIAAGIFWKLTFSDRYTWLENPDQALQARPWFDYESRELHAGRIPLWAPYELAGQSLIGQVQPGVVNPINWLLFAMPIRDGHIPIRTLNLWWVLIHWIAAVFAYLLCRDLGCGRVASVLGGSIFGYLGYIGWAGTPAFMTSSLWFPLVLLFFARVFRGERPVANAAWCGAALGASFLGGHHNVPVYSAVVLGASWLWLLAREWRVRRMWAAAAACLAACVLVSAVQALPAIEYGRQALRWSGAPEPQRWGDRVPYSVHEEYGLKMQSLPGFVVRGVPVHANPYVGIVAIGLALAAIVRRWKSPEVRLLAFIAVFAVLLALGSDTPVQRLAYRFIPMVEKARYPAMAVVLAHAAIAALAAIGLTAVQVMWKRAAGPLAIAALALLLVEAAMLERPILRPRGFAGSFENLMNDQADIAAFLKRQPGWFRAAFDEAAVPYNFGDFHAVEQFDGYFASRPVRFQEAAFSPAAPRYYGVRYHVAMQPSKPAEVEVFASRSGVKVFRDPAIGEPLWVEHDAPCDRPDRLRVARRVPGESVFEAELGCAGLLVSGDPYYRGWRALDGGRRLPIQEFGLGVSAVRLDAGSHRVEYRYQPWSVRAGTILTLFGLVGCAALSAVRRDT